MEPVQAWTLMAFVTLVSAALLLLELGMRRAHNVQNAIGRRDPRRTKG
jgi:hypothetical protein